MREVFLNLMRTVPSVFQGFLFPCNRTSYTSSWVAIRSFSLPFHCVKIAPFILLGSVWAVSSVLTCQVALFRTFFILVRVSWSALPVGVGLLPGRMGECLTLENNLALSYRAFVPASSDPRPPQRSVFLFWIFANWMRMKWYFIWS